MKPDAPHILLINPWIHDFAAYDFWAKPLGLLTLASILRKHGYHVTYIDCLDRFHPKDPHPKADAKHGRGSYLKTRIPKPAGLEDIPRNFCRYGIKKQWLIKDLLGIPKPNLVLVTSLMTYWYSGVQETIDVIKSIFFDVPIVVGGTYASLCKDHAINHLNADQIITGPGEQCILDLAEKYTGFSVRPAFDADDLETYPYPAFELQRKIAYVPLTTSRGCPYRCKYCASHLLNKKRMVRQPMSVVEEIKYWHNHFKVRDFAFYDDALLVDSEHHAMPMLEGIIKAGLNVHFHTPNAIHIREISKSIAHLMFQAGFKTLRLGLETAVFEQRLGLDKKLTDHEFRRAVSYLTDAGFNRDMMGAYLLIGLPGQKLEAIVDS
ncbi:MAG: radical SAM protein, partial [Desulfobacterales bacterium]